MATRISAETQKFIQGLSGRDKTQALLKARQGASLETLKQIFGNGSPAPNNILPPISAPTPTFAQSATNPFPDDYIHYNYVKYIEEITTYGGILPTDNYFS